MNVKVIISSVASRTALACSMLSVFYPKEELAGKRLKDLDQKVIAAMAGNFKKGEAKISIKFCVKTKLKSVFSITCTSGLKIIIIPQIFSLTRDWSKQVM